MAPLRSAMESIRKVSKATREPAARKCVPALFFAPGRRWRTKKPLALGISFGLEFHLTLFFTASIKAFVRPSDFNLSNVTVSTMSYLAP
jgi:hypothetical protein